MAEIYDPEERQLYRFLGRVTEVEDLILVSDQVDQSTREKVTTVVSDLRSVLSGGNPNTVNIGRWDGMLAQCMEGLGIYQQTALDSNSAEQLYRCLADIRIDIEAST